MAPKVVLEQAAVGLLGGVEHRNAVERGTGADGVDHRSHRCPHLVVGIGRGEDAGGAR